MLLGIQNITEIPTFQTEFDEDGKVSVIKEINFENRAYCGFKFRFILGNSKNLRRSSGSW